MKKALLFIFTLILVTKCSFAEEEMQNYFDQTSEWVNSLIKTPEEADLSTIQEIHPEYTTQPKEASYNASQLEQKTKELHHHEALELTSASEFQLAPVATIMEEAWVKGPDGLYEKIVENPEEYIKTQYKDCKQVPILSPQKLEEETLKCRETVDIELSNIQSLKIEVENHIENRTFKLDKEPRFESAGIKNFYFSSFSLVTMSLFAPELYTTKTEIIGQIQVKELDRTYNFPYIKYYLNPQHLSPIFKSTNVDSSLVTEVTYVAKAIYSEPDNMTLQYTLKKHDISSEEWLNTNPLLNDLSESGYCDAIEETCIEGPETRIINGLPVQRDCWKRQITYKCGHDAPSKCPNYRKLGCEQIEHQCIKSIGEQCVEYEKTYHCKKMIQNPTGKYQLLCADLPFCINGDCVFDGYEANHDMLEAVSKLKIFEELSKQVQKDGLNIFTGDCGRCRKNGFGFRSCCGKGAGWGKSFGAKCSEGEKTLASQRTKGLCHYVGTYCSKKVLGKCVEKKQSHCCFKGKIQRILQEQIRAQLGITWGSGKNPECRGLTLQELSKADWEQLDLSELFNEILEQMDLPDTDAITKGMRIQPVIDGSKIPNMANLGASVNLTVKNKVSLNHLKSSTKSGLILPKEAN